MPQYNKPSGLVKKLNSALGWVFARGLGSKRWVQIEHRGRKSGKTYKTAVNWTEVDGQRYLVAPRGETQWVRNVRADGGKAVLTHGKSQKVRLEEISVDQRAPIIKNYVGENKVVKGEFGLEPDDPIEKYEGIASEHPTFRIHES
ncbi:MAG TPA: nitroreductase/quinone reductase family protein [Dehalococcoidia bacterium]|nr:nitroreductase/quinone reductase family protein [Dehalococcoidia bacterium]